MPVLHKRRSNESFAINNFNRLPNNILKTSTRQGGRHATTILLQREQEPFHSKESGLQVGVNKHYGYIAQWA